MKQKAFVLHNKGMNRDLSISKAAESSAYENHNIRVLARDHDTMLSVTNERGNKLVILNGTVNDNLRITEDEELRITENELYRTVPDENLDTIDFEGILIGWNVLNENVILFTNEGTTDRIYRVVYEYDINSEQYVFTPHLLFVGSLGFELQFPIESVVYYETEYIQKIYWVDGKNVLRFMNFAAKPDEETGLLPWQISEDEYDNTYFDSNRAVDFGVEVKIKKDNSGNTRPNGVIQYLLTYFNKHGQESGYVWVSDLVYLSPVASGGAADGTNNNSVTLSISNLDTRFDHFRVYSVFRSALNGTTVGYIVFEGKTDAGNAVVVDNNSHLTAVDSSQLLYLGSQNVVAGTLTHKDNTLFLGDLSSVDRNYDGVEATLKKYMRTDPDNPWKCTKITFDRDTDAIPNETGDGSYAYNSQLVDSSSKITSFKGGEKYRFGIVFHKKDGSLTDAFWIGDAVNDKYPVMTDDSVQRIIAKCSLPAEVVDMMEDNGFQTAQLMIAEATYADRAVKAQGIVCPTVFNVWNRYMNRLYAASSWLMRPRNSEYAWKHFEAIHDSTSSTGEIDCNYSYMANVRPYYVLDNYATSPEYNDKFNGIGEYSHVMIIYRINCMRNLSTLGFNRYFAGVTLVFGKALTGSFNTSYIFTDDSSNSSNSNPISFIINSINSGKTESFIFNDGECQYKIHNFRAYAGVGTGNDQKTETYTKVLDAIRSKYGFLVDELVSGTTFYNWCIMASEDANTVFYFNNKFTTTRYPNVAAALNNNSSDLVNRWYTIGEESVLSSAMDYAPSYYRKHLTFIDENVITLNSPEIEYEAVSFDKIDGYKFRIVGIAKINGNYSDYTVDASPGKLSGENLVKEHFSRTLIAWPLWKEFGLDPRAYEADTDPNNPKEHSIEPDVKDRDSYDYEWSGSFMKYWLRMWNHSGKITGFTDYDNDDYSTLHHKTFANLRFSNKTQYANYGSGWESDTDSVRIFNYTSSQYVNIDIDDMTRYYNGIINESLSMPGDHVYPVLYSSEIANTSGMTSSTSAYLYQADPISITYSSTPHAVISLPTKSNEPRNGKYYYEQTILPKWNFPGITGESASVATEGNGSTGALIPWINNTSSTSYPYKDYIIKQDTFEIPNAGVSPSTKYLYIGEIYKELEDGDEERYGGTTDAAIQNNRFLIAGPQYRLSDLASDNTMIANQGDTYVQRWDCLKTKPYSSDCVNNVIDITSVMLETHINIDGRTDLQRGTSYIASIDAEKWGSLNPVYSQNNNFITQRDLDADFNLDSYRSSITWTLEKHDSEDVDAWSHITLASTLKLDGDKGVCRALRRLQNSIISFQDRGISEILFNSRTQLSTQDGVPVEIANSGKVDGKRYITNKYGCTNKWSIVEGKNALYFVDNINKAFCAFNGQAIESLSAKLGFSAWFREINDTNPWRPIEFNNIVSYYDKIHSDIYLVRNTNDDMPCLVYSENLGAFTSFFDYSAVLMMTNVNDRFVSYRDHHLWLQNEGLYCNFFGHQYDYWMQYRVTPEPFSDKIWTNIDYRADFYQVLDENGNAIVPEENLINGDTFGQMEDLYKEWETFTDYRVWDEYQTTGFVPLTHEHFDRDDVRKKFRIWRLAIPRALKEGTNKYGMDRIRNPWINILFRKSNSDGKHLVQLHDFVVKYFE